MKSDEIRYWQTSPFPCNEDINERVILHAGDVRPLKADAIVNPTNENLTQLDYVAKLAGPDLESHIRTKVRVCPTGDVRLTPGFNSNFKYIIHAVPPKYQPKYKTAAETALYHTYFKVLETMIENKLRSVVLPTLKTAKCNLPLEENCHMQLRIVRRILEKKLDQFDKIILHVQNGTEQYESIFICYFPRTKLDEEMSCYKLGESIGGPNGEPVIPEREIRIKSKPTAMDPDDVDRSVDLSSGLDLSTVVGKTAFSRMRDDKQLATTLNGAMPAKNNLFSTFQGNQHMGASRSSQTFRGCTLL